MFNGKKNENIQVYNVYYTYKESVYKGDIIKY